MTSPLTLVKQLLDVADTAEFDSLLTGLIDVAVTRLAPRAYLASPRVTMAIPTIASDGEVDLDHATASNAATFKKIQYYDGSVWRDVSHKEQFGGHTYFFVDSSATQLRLYPFVPYTLATVPKHLEQAVIWLTQAGFYDFVAGTKRQYNGYMQNGTDDVETMRDMSTTYESKANAYIDTQSYNQ